MMIEAMHLWTGIFMIHWVLERTNHPRFPYLLRLEGEDGDLLRLLVQEKWPAPGSNIFCLRTDAQQTYSTGRTEVERIPVVSMRRYGKRLAIVLDRASRKRCDFLFLKRPYKNRPGEYEQIFWRTQLSLSQRRPRVKLTARGMEELRITVDVNERRPWRFPGCTILREKLPVGDYALMEGRRIKAVVERKTLDNLLHHFGQMAPLHQVLGELEAYPFGALVIEASYADFLNPKFTHPYKPSFVSRALGEIFALHPKLQIVFAGNRKLANQWTLRFFSAIMSHEQDVPHLSIKEAEARYKHAADYCGGVYFETLTAIVEMPERFTLQQLRDALPHIPDSTLRRALKRLKTEGRIICHRAGPRSVWVRTQTDGRDP
jgi:hypothetical protein